MDSDINNRAPGPEWTYYYGKWVVGGERESFLLASIAPGAVTSPDVAPLGNGELSAEDSSKLESQGIPADCQDDVSIVRARISLDRDLHLSREEISTDENELTCDYVLRELRRFLNHLEKPGATIYYIGHGRRNSGDWCFKDGFITFADIVDLYNATSIQGRTLTIVSDCSYSGTWVEKLSQYLDQHSVRPCGHSTVDTGILLKVYASCRPGELANSLSYSVRGMVNEKNRGDVGHFLNLELSKTQHTYGCNFTALRCGRTPQENCLLVSSDYTWQKVLAGSRVHLVRGKDRGRAAWHYVLIVDDDETREEFLQKVKAGTVDVAQYGQVLKSGWGEDPPNEVVDEIEKQYSRAYT